MSSISVVSEYTPVQKAMSVHTKNWAVKPKPPQKGIERTMKGPVKVKLGRNELRKKVETVTFDNPDEMLKGMQQETDKRLDRFRYPDQADFTNVEKRYTNGRWSHELVAKILKMNPKLWVEDSKNVKGCAGFYKMAGGEKVTAGKPNASFRHGFMPEGTIMKEDKAGLAFEFIFGWRQVLIRLRRSGDLTPSQFRRLYGVVVNSDVSAKHFASDLGEYAV